MSLRNRRAAARLTRAAALIGAMTVPAIAGFAGTPSAVPQTIDVPGLQKEIAAHKGKIVILNLWATWCPGCVEEFPSLVKVQSADHAKGLDLITISFDDAPNVAKAVVPFLTKNHLATGIFVNSKGSRLDDAYPAFLEPKLAADDPFGIPRTYVFDRTGKLVKVFVGAQTYAAFQKAIAPLLKARS